jgi:site-specific recombinase XerD
MFATRMRVGGALSLNLSDFLLQEAVFRIRGEGGRTRLAFAEDQITLKIRHLIANFWKEAGIETCIAPHMLRQIVATLRLRNGVDVQVEQEYLGHVLL